MSQRFFSDSPITGERAALDGPEAHHALHVMRARVGDRVTLFDDSGAEFEAEVVAYGRGDVQLRILERREIDRELPFELVVGVSLPKGDRQKWLVEKLTELGVTSLMPLVTERGVAQPTAGALDRLRRSGIEAAKQCGRNRLMKVAEPQAWPTYLSSESAAGSARRLVAHFGGISLAELDRDISKAIPTELAIGPEGGFTDEEAAAAVAAGWQIVDLGPRILRVETAAIALAAVVAASGRS
jgi:16S rRNA (uracil1498-N3)-methyltransferase